MSGGLSVKFLASEAEIPAGLWEACVPQPFEGRWWYQSLEASGLDDQFTFSYAVLFDGQRAVGLAPVFMMTLQLGLAVPERLRPILAVPARIFPFLSDPRALFVGSPCSDEGWFGLLPDIDRRAAMLRLQDALEAEARARDAAMIIWKDFAASDDDDFRWLTRQRRLFPMVGFPGTVAEIPNARKEDYFTSLKRTQRATLKRKLRRSAERVEIDVEVVERPDDETLDAIFALFWQTFEKAPMKFERLNRRFFDNVRELSPCHFILLRERTSRDILAFKLCFLVGDRIINKFIGIDYNRPREWMLYFRLWDATLDWACGQGVTTIQSGQTGYAAKIGIGHRLVSLTNYCQHRNGLIHKAFGFFASRISWRTLDGELATFLDARSEADSHQ